MEKKKSRLDIYNWFVLYTYSWFFFSTKVNDKTAKYERIGKRNRFKKLDLLDTFCTYTLNRGRSIN